MLNVVMLSVVMLNVVMLGVVASPRPAPYNFVFIVSPHLKKSFNILYHHLKIKQIGKKKIKLV